MLHHAVGFVFAVNSNSIVAAALAGSPCAGDRQTSVASVKALAASGKVSSLDPMQPAATPPLKPSGIVVNCPIMATVRQPTGADSTAQAVVGTPFVQAGAVNLAANTVKLPLHRATLPDNTAVYFIVTEASSKDAAAVWGASHAAALAQTSGSAVVQQGVPVGTPSATAGVTPAQTLRVNATVNFLHGTRRVTPDPSTGFPPTNFSFSAQGNAGKC
jgi:hypothetical protein